MMQSSLSELESPWMRVPFSRIHGFAVGKAIFLNWYKSAKILVYWSVDGQWTKVTSLKEYSQENKLPCGNEI